LPLTIVIASFLEPHYVEQIQQAVPEARILYDPALIPPPRYVADHIGRPDFRRNSEDEARFRSWLAEADVLYDFDRHLTPELPQLAPKLRWIQATSSGIGPFIERAGLDKTDITITNAAGIHAAPLAEHSLLSMLYFTKEIPRLQQQQRAHRWERYCGQELRGRTLGVIGLGAVGKEIARLSRAVGLRVLGVKRTPAPNPLDYHVDELFVQRDLHTVLPRCHFVVLICPHTPETEGMMGTEEFSLLPKGAVLINVGRGALVQEEALLTALGSGHLAGAALDVTATEPLPADHPLWDKANVLITSHSASTVEVENARLTDLFCENLRRFHTDKPLINLFHP
jgi:phosphoglycerate dehydrogenase-like enzyme